jgi:hypothetical protein
MQAFIRVSRSRDFFYLEMLLYLQMIQLKVHDAR